MVKPFAKRAHGGAVASEQLAVVTGVSGRVWLLNLSPRTGDQPTTDDMMDLRSLLETAPDAHVLREMIGSAAERLMELGWPRTSAAPTWRRHSPELRKRSRSRPCRYLCDVDLELRATSGGGPRQPGSSRSISGPLLCGRPDKSCRQLRRQSVCRRQIKPRTHVWGGNRHH